MAANQRKTSAPDSIKLIQKIVEDTAHAHTEKTERALGDRTGEPIEEPPEPARSQAFYVYVDKTGMEHIVDSYKLVPKRFRKTAKKWIMDHGDDRGVQQLKDLGASVVQRVETLASPSGGSGFHLASFLLGAILAGVLFIASFTFKRGGNLVTKAIVLVVAVGIASSAYLGWVRRQAGLTDDVVATPGKIIQDARDAVRSLEGRLERDRRQLLELEKE